MDAEICYTAAHIRCAPFLLLAQDANRLSDQQQSFADGSQLSLGSSSRAGSNLTWEFDAASDLVCFYISK